VRDVAALIVAAGRGSRFGGELPKVLVDLGGQPLLLWAVRAYDRHPCVNRVVLVVGEQFAARAEALCASACLRHRVHVVSGGPRRQDSVLLGLQSMQGEPPSLVAIHDGARPLIDEATITSSLRLAARRGGCVTAAPVTDTIKQADESGTVVGTLDRRLLWSAQTPQTFAYGLLIDCYHRAGSEGWEVTDDASVMELCGHPVCINPGRASNIKVTTPEDLTLAAALLAHGRGGGTPPPAAAEPSGAFRVGHGYDVHALVPGRRLIVGGVQIPHPTGLAGHSDADVLLHAICDALLGAAALGDIGALFPDSDALYRDMDSAVFCRRVAAAVREAGYEIANLDATVIAQQPRLSPHIQAMRANIAAALGVDTGRISVKATTTEKLGFEGREEGIAAEAVALLQTGGVGRPAPPSPALRRIP